MEILNYITSELHKSYGPLFNPKISADWRASIIAGFDKKFAWLSKLLESRTYVMGNTFTVADAYLFTVLRWSPRVGIDLAKWPTLAAYVARVEQRPKVQQALKDEGLIK
jgi:glutathione S-transferase